MSIQKQTLNAPSTAATVRPGEYAMFAKKKPIRKRQTSQKQIEANRRNALKSCGPNTPAGRAISSQNARKHQLLPFEDAASVAKLTAEYYRRFIPTTFDERVLVDVISFAERVRRYCPHSKPTFTRAISQQLLTPKPNQSKKSSTPCLADWHSCRNTASKPIAPNEVRSPT